MPPSAPRRVLCLLAVLLSLVTAIRLTRGAAVAGAAVAHGDGYSATVLGFTGWYGSYRLGGAGSAWCIDHGSHAPDAAFGYATTTVDDVPEPSRRAVAWAVGRFGPAADRPMAAALMLVAHDLMGAVYPSGRMDVDRLTPRQLAGFDDAGSVISVARVVKADALAHAGLVPPLVLTVDMPSADAEAPATAVARVTDRVGAPVAGIDVSVTPAGPALTSPEHVVTDASGAASFTYTAAVGEDRLDARASAPDLELHALASTTRAAQRVAVPATVTLSTTAGYEVLAPTTTTSAWHTTTVPPTTRPPRAPTTTIAPAAATTTTTALSTTTSSTSTSISTSTSTSSTTTSSTTAPTTTVPSTSTTVPSTTIASTTTVPTTAAPPAAVATRALPRTGAAGTGALASTGLGLVLLGGAVHTATRRPRRGGAK